MNLGKIIEILDAEVIVNGDCHDSEISSICSSDLMSDLLHFSKTSGALLITGLIQPQVVRTAEMSDIKAIAFVLNKRPEKETVALAGEKGISLLVTRLSRFTACGKLYIEGLRSCTGEER